MDILGHTFVTLKNYTVLYYGGPTTYETRHTQALYLNFFFHFCAKKRGEQKHALKGQIKIFKGCSFACIFFWLSFVDCKVSKIITLFCAYAPWKSLDYNLGYSFHFNLSVNQISEPHDFFHVSYSKWFLLFIYFLYWID